MSTILDQIFALQNPLGTLFSYFRQLHPASYNGVTFITRSNSTTVGRRNAEHVYPFRDLPWMEDMGRKGRKYRIVGFLVGDDVIQQRNQMQAALEKQGPGVLVHPTYGRLTVSAGDDCTFEESYTHGRVIEMSLSFHETGQKLYPSNGIATGTNVNNMADAANQSVLAAFSASVTGYLSEGAQAVQSALKSVSEWTGEVQTLANNATNIYHLASTLPGTFGRFFGGGSGSGASSIVGNYTSASQVASQMTDLINTAADDRGNIIGAIGNVTSVAGSL